MLVVLVVLVLPALLVACYRRFDALTMLVAMV
jgi:hypothetical protein